jgi:antitoxin Phd
MKGIPMPKALKQPLPQATPAKIKNLSLAGPGWQLQAAKARFSEVFRRARAEGPQLITRQGKDGVVMLPVEQFDRLVNRSRRPKSLVQFFRESPLVGLELDFERDQDTGRDIEL